MKFQSTFLAFFFFLFQNLSTTVNWENNLQLNWELMSENRGHLENIFTQSLRLFSLLYIFAFSGCCWGALRCDGLVQASVTVVGGRRAGVGAGAASSPHEHAPNGHHKTRYIRYQSGIKFSLFYWHQCRKEDPHINRLLIILLNKILTHLIFTHPACE